MIQSAFEITTPPGTLRGTVYRPDESRRPAVLFAHSFTGNRIENGFMFVKLARELASLGIASITFDFLGSGESDGSFNDMTVTGEIRDALAVHRWAHAQPWLDRSRLGGLGFSLGGLVISCVHAQVKFKALTLLAPTTANNLERYARQNHPSQTLIDVGPHTLSTKLFEDLKKTNSLRDVTTPAVPTLVIQGTADKVVAPSVSQQYVDAVRNAGASVDHRIIEQANHPFSSPNARRQLYAEVRDFFAKQLMT